VTQRYDDAAAQIAEAYYHLRNAILALRHEYEDTADRSMVADLQQVRGLADKIKTVHAEMRRYHQ
jgi:hypothetical protein